MVSKLASVFQRYHHLLCAFLGEMVSHIAYGMFMFTACMVMSGCLIVRTARCSWETVSDPLCADRQANRLVDARDIAHCFHFSTSVVALLVRSSSTP